MDGRCASCTAMPKLTEILRKNSQATKMSLARLLLLCMQRRFSSLRFNGTCNCEIAGDVVEATGGILSPWRHSAEVVVRQLAHLFRLTGDDVDETLEAMGGLARECKNFYIKIYRSELNEADRVPRAYATILHQVLPAIRPCRGGICPVCESLAALPASLPVPPATGPSASSSATRFAPPPPGLAPPPPQAKSPAASALSTATGLAKPPPAPPPRASVPAAANETKLAQRTAAVEAERLRQQEEALPEAAQETERLSVADQARRVAVEKAERPRQRLQAQREGQREEQEEALRATAEEARQQEEVQRERVRVEEQSYRVAAEPRRPMSITDSRFEVGGRSNRALLCDNCEEWFKGKEVGSFGHMGAVGMPAAELRRAAWERGEWDASWYCIQCFAEYWNCEKETVMQFLGFSKQQSGKDPWMSARASSSSTGPANPPKASKPAIIKDSRFGKERELRKIICDGCYKVKVGNEAGAFWDREAMPVAGARGAAWERGAWDASWYCTDCYMLYYNCSHEAVYQRLGFTERAGKKARFAKGKA